jgi:eukaryotic-like serine/threonine-protein kinase
MAIAKGTLLGPYEILARIGAGGMGEVWRARDKRIGRDVAVKVLPEEFTEGDQQIRRFEQEARAAGSLNHPGLVTIFDVGTTDGSPYIVMELLEGQTLRELMDTSPGPMRVRRAVEYGIQIATALAVAHDKGIIHRDLKPENLFITSDRRVKILDFGLAKLAQDAKEIDTRRKTARHLTSVGIVVGTPGYMSPEQVTAKALDHRTDIFSLGSVLYEMLSGRPAFDAYSAIETMHAVLNTEPPALPAIVPDIPQTLDAIVGHCMEKDPQDRFQSARDLAFQLRTMPEMQDSMTGNRRPLPGAKRRPYRAAIAAVAAAVALAAGGFAFYRLGAGEPQATPRTFRQLTFGDGLEMFPTLAPDGATFAYVSAHPGNRDIYVQRVDGRTAINITSDSPEDDSEPAFSPDGSQIAFRSERGEGGIFLMGVTGESVRRLSDFGYNPAWSPDGTKIAVATERVEFQPRNRHVRSSELWVIDVRTGAKRPLVQAGVGGGDFGSGSDGVQPSWSPNGKRIAFWGLSDSVGNRDLWTIDPHAPKPKETVVRVTSDAAIEWNPVWSPDGRYLYFGSDRDGTMNLWRIAVDSDTGKAAGVPEPMSLPAIYSGSFAVSRRGDVGYVTTTRTYRLIALPFDAKRGVTGEPRTVLEGSLEALSFNPSPDQRSMAFTAGGAQEDVFVVDADGTRLRQLTNDAARDRGVTWSNDGRTLFFYSNRDGAYHVWSIGADGGGLTRLTSDADLRRGGAKNLYVPVLSPDGRMLAVQSETSPALIHLDRPQGQRYEKLEPPPASFGAGFPAWSPDGSRLVLSLRAVNGDTIPGAVVYTLATRQYRVVSERGHSSQWLPDAKRIIFFEKNSIGVADVDSGTVTTHKVAPIPGAHLDDAVLAPRISRDGSTLYIRQVLEQGDIWLVQNDVTREDG